MTDGFTLLESGTSRIHFQLAKALEDATTDFQRSSIIHATLKDARSRITTRSTSSDLAKLASLLLTILHCTEHHPYTNAHTDGSSSCAIPFDFGFALLPALELLSTATKWKHVLIAYQLLHVVLPPSHGSNAGKAQDITTSSLMLLNTFRKNLTNSGRRLEQLLHSSQSLLSLAQGVPSGSDMLSTLAAPLLDLTRHKDPLIRKQAICAMLRCAEDDQRYTEGAKDSTEMVDALLTVVRLMLASTYAFEAGSNLGEQGGQIINEIERRAETDPSVLRTCVRVIDLCRVTAMITPREAACHVVEILQAMHYIAADLPMDGLHNNISKEAHTKLTSIRTGVGARHLSSLKHQYDYHGLFCPWLLSACLASLQQSASSSDRDALGGQEHLLDAVLGMYATACVGKAASLAVCVSAARCIAAIYTSTNPKHTSSWITLAGHIKAQLASNNANRKIAALELLDALLPTKWHQPVPLDQADAMQPPFSLTEHDMGRLMDLANHRDDTVRKRVLRLLHKIDKQILQLRQEQVQTPLLHPEHGSLTPYAKNLDAATQLQFAEWLIEVAFLRLSSAQEEQQQCSPDDMDNFVSTCVVCFELGLFSPDDVSQVAAAERFVLSLRALRLVDRAAFYTSAMAWGAWQGSRRSSGLHMIAVLLCDLDHADVEAGGFERNYREMLELLLSNTHTDFGLRYLAAAARAIAVTSKLSSSAPSVLDGRSIDSASISSDISIACRNYTDLCDDLDKRPLDQDTLRKVQRLTTPLMSLLEAVDTLLTLHDENPAQDAGGGEDSSTSPVQSRELELGRSTSTLRSPKARSATRRPSTVVERQASAIPSEAKRNRDRQIATAFSHSAAQLVLGTQARPAHDPTYDSDSRSQSAADSQLIFSAHSSEFGSTAAANNMAVGDDAVLVDTVIDPDRSLEPRAGVTDGTVQPSLMDLVHQCHNFDPWSDLELHPFVLDGTQIGFMPAVVYQLAMQDSEDQKSQGLPSPFTPIYFTNPTSGLLRRGLSFSDEVNQSVESRTVAINQVVQRWRSQRVFPDPLDGWRDELYAIYGRRPPSTSTSTTVQKHQMAFKLERSACALFGFATFGVHLTAYTHNAEGEMMVWVPTRSATKSTWPGYLDNSVAGGIVAGDAPMDSIIRECLEEAALPSTTTQKYIRQTGVLSYCYRTAPSPHNHRWIQPEIEYVYDLPLPPNIILEPKDGEVQHFQLMSLPQVQREMRNARFKPNCVLVILGFLIRHGHITADDEPDYRHIVAQIHTDLKLPGP